MWQTATFPLASLVATQTAFRRRGDSCIEQQQQNYVQQEPNKACLLADLTSDVNSCAHWFDRVPVPSACRACALLLPCFCRGIEGCARGCYHS